MWIGIISLFPSMFEALAHGVIGQAQTRGLLQLQYWNPRDFATNVHRTVDDRPYGGGPGMVMMAAPVVAAITAAKAAAPAGTPVILMSPQGRPLTHQGAVELSQDLQALPGVILIAGRYEGIDQRVIDHYVDQQWSIGDYVLSGGELAAMVLLDTVVRLQPGVLGNAHSAEQDSFCQGLLDHPHYTRPANFEGWPVPPVLTSGSHADINRWRLKQSLGQTAQRRPDLLAQRALSEHEQTLLEEYKCEHNLGVDDE